MLLGHEVTLLCYAEPQQHEFPRALGRSSRDFEKLGMIGIKPEGLAGGLFASSARKQLRSLARSAEVMHVHGVWRPIYIAASQVAVSQQCALVIEPHGMLDPWSLRQSFLKKKLAMTLIWKRLLNSASFILALNETEAQLLEPLKLRCPIRVFPNGVFPDEFARLPDGRLFRERHSIGADRRYILFLGRLHYKKGLDYLIESFKLFCMENDDTDLVVAGPDGGMRAAFEGWVKNYGLVDRVRIVGPVYGAEKMSAMCGAHCFCLPSRQEGFSVAILEAMACGVPVVISKECHFPEVAAAHAGEVVKLEPKDICDAMLRIVTDTELQKRASVAARDLALFRYDWMVIARDVVEGYKSCL